MPAPLANVVVIDLTRVLAGPYCTMLLADLGARVIKVEHPQGGDDARMIGPFVELDADLDVEDSPPDNSKATQEENSAYYAAFNRGKESVTLDLKDPAHKKLFHKLLANADVLVENFSYGTMERLGLGYAHLKRKYPQLIYASISGFGHTGEMKHLPAYDIIAQALGGIMSITGAASEGNGGNQISAPPSQTSGENPTSGNQNPTSGNSGNQTGNQKGDQTENQVRVGASIGDVGAALFCAIGIVSALYGRTKHNRGDKLDVAMLDCQVAMLENAVARYFITKKAPTPLGARHSTITPFDSFRTADRPIVLAAANERVFQRLCTALGKPTGLGDVRFAHNKLRTRHHKLLKQRLEQTLTTRSASYWIKQLTKHNVPSALIQSVAETVKMPQLKQRHMIVKTKGKPAFWLAGNPIKLGNLADSATRPRPPKLGEHNKKLF